MDKTETIKELKQKISDLENEQAAEFKEHQEFCRLADSTVNDLRTLISLIGVVLMGRGRYKRKCKAIEAMLNIFIQEDIKNFKEVHDEKDR